MRSRFLTSLAGIALLAAPVAAHAQGLVLSSMTPATFSGTGLGSVATLLTLSSQGNSTSETGCVSYDGSGNVFGGMLGAAGCQGTSADIQTGTSQSQAQLLSALGITSASQFGLLFNASEPSGNGVTVQSLTATFYDGTGGLLGSLALTPTPVSFDNTLTGVGNSGYLFTVSGTPNANFFAAGNYVGLSATVGCATTESATCLGATGGLDTFSLVNAGSPSTVPEPGTYALLATGLAGLAAVARRRRLS